jgi:protease-4
MKKFLLGILCGFVFAGLATIILGFALLRLATKKEVDTPAESYLVLRLEGQIAEQPPEEFPIPWLDQRSPWTVLEIKQVLESAARDSRVKGLMLETGGASLGWAKAQEIRAAILDFRKSNKPVFAYMRRPSAKDYFLASAADRVSMVDEDILDLKGLRVERTFYKNTLDKLGVQMEVVHAGKYKDFGDTYVKTSMSPESKEALGGILDGIYAVLLNGLAESRKRTPAEIEKLMDDGPYLASKALDTKLVDALEFDNQAREQLAKRANVSTKSAVSAREYRKRIRRRWDRDTGNRIAYFVAEGDIVRGSGLGDGTIASRDFISHVYALKNDESYKGVLLRIDSPGGDAVASDELLAALKDLSKVKPVVISMSDVAASGGYYMAVTGDPIYAYPATITGSIGVVYGRPNLKGLYDKLGMTQDGLQRGKNADIDSLSKPLTDVARQKLREGVDASYRTFVSKVAEGRKAKVEEIEPLAQGRAWIASDAKARRLTDSLGGIDAALAELRKRAKIAPDAKIDLVPYPAPENAIEKWFRDEKTMSAALGGLIQFEKPALVDEIQRALRPALRQGGMLRWMPYTIEVK